jgi:DNA gyrase subunit A
VAERDEENGGEAALSQERYIEMSAAEQFVLTISANGYGKRTSSFEYRITGRGGKGIVAITVNERNGPLVASFPVEHTDQIMLVTDRGQLIRTPVDDIRIAGRSTQGVTLFDVAEGETVVSVERLSEEEAAEGDDNGEGEGEGEGNGNGEGGGE